jgi:lysophospholipase L1-like esterase
MLVRSRLRALAAAAITIATAAAALAAAPARAQPASAYYLALGDSLANGEQWGPAGEVYQQGYAQDIAAATGLTLVDLGCSGGETTATFVSGGICSYPGSGSQLAAAEAFLSAHPGQVAMVSLDIGADNFGPCFTGTGLSPACLATAEAQVILQLPQILAGLRSAAGTGVPIVAMNYYDPYLGLWLDGGPSQAEAQATVAAVAAFNTAEVAEYTLYGVPVADVYNAFAAGQLLPLGTYGSQQVPQNVAQTCQLTWYCSHGNIHADTTGYQLIASTLLDELGP